MIENKRNVVMNRTTTNKVGTEALEQEIKHVVETAVTREEIEDAASSQPFFEYHENSEYIGIQSERLYHIRSQRLADTFGELGSDECAIDWSKIANSVSTQVRTQFNLGNEQPLPFVSRRKHAETHDVTFSAFTAQLANYTDYTQQNVLAEILHTLRERHELVKQNDDAYTVVKTRGYRKYDIRDENAWTHKIDKILNRTNTNHSEDMPNKCLLAYAEVTQENHNVTLRFENQRKDYLVEAL